MTNDALEVWPETPIPPQAIVFLTSIIDGNGGMLQRITYTTMLYKSCNTSASRSVKPGHWLSGQTSRHAIAHRRLARGSCPCSRDYWRYRSDITDAVPYRGNQLCRPGGGWPRHLRFVGVAYWTPPGGLGRYPPGDSVTTQREIHADGRGCCLDRAQRGDGRLSC